MREERGREGRGQSVVDGAVKRSMATLACFVWEMPFSGKGNGG